MKEIKKDKHGFTVIKHKLSIRLFFKFLLTAAVCIYALYRCTLRASADTITLSPSQTVALLGSEVEGVVHSSSAGNVPCYAIPTGLVSSDYTPTGSFTNIFLYGSNSFQTYPTFNTAFPDFTGRQYVIYAVSSTPRVITGWPSWSASDSSSTSDFTCSFSLPIQSCTSMQFSVIYTGVGYVGYYGGTYNTNCTLQKTGSVVGRHPLGQYYYDTRIFSALWPFYNGSYGADASNVPENNRESVNLIPLDFSENEPCSVSGFSLALNMVWAVDVDDGCPLNDFLFTQGLKVPLLLIECPTISDYVPVTTAPPVTTTAPATTRREYPLGGAQTAAPVQTVDLSYLESGVVAIVEQQLEMNNNLDWIGNNVMIGVNNLAYIANRLDDIYNRMWNEGELNLEYGFAPPTNQNLHDFVVSALATHTNTVSESSYNLRGGMSTYFDIGNSLLSSPLFQPFVLVAAVGLALAVLAFVLFRGY